MRRIVRIIRTGFIAMNVLWVFTGTPNLHHSAIAKSVLARSNRQVLPKVASESTTTQTTPAYTVKKATAGSIVNCEFQSN